MRRRVASIRNFAEVRVTEGRAEHDLNELLDIFVKHNQPMIHGCLATKSGLQKRRATMASNWQSCWR